MDDAASGRLTFKVDKPADADGFGVHGRIANAIVEVVREQPDIKMIGLLGGWGSGKSTIVGLMKTKLQASGAEDEIRCFIYDTWLRQSEPPRRAFLEGLIAFLAKPGKVTEQDELIEQELAELLGHRETVDTELSIKLTGPAKVMAILIALLPVALKLIGGGTLPADTFREFAIWPLERFWPATLFVLGWVFTLLPFLAVAGLCVVGGKTLSEVASLFANKPGETRRETRTRRPEPSAIEFQALFTRILAEEVGDPRKLLIVIDNLDRLPPEEALTLWATMRGFFLEARASKDEAEALSKLPTVLVPIDPAAPGRIHGDAGRPTGAKETAAPAETAPSKDSKSPGLSQAFVDKTFDLVFHVPQPVLSGWQHYLEDRLKAVFGSELETDAPLDVRVIYEAFHRQKAAGAKVTPRDLNTFVNSVAAVWIQHRGDGIRLATMAYFVCDRTRLTHDLHGALADPVVDVMAYDPDGRRGLAALAFGVDKAAADELYMKEPIRKAIQDDDPTAFGALADEPGFDIYLDQVLDEQTTVSILATARVLGRADLKAPWTPRIWRRLRTAAPKHLTMAAFAEGDDEGLAALHATLQDNERLAFVRAMSATLGVADPPRLLQQHGRHTAAVVKRLVELAETDGEASLAIPLPGHERVYAFVVGQDLPETARRALRSQQSHDASLADAEAMVLGPEPEPFRLGMRALGWFAQAQIPSQGWTAAYEAVAATLKSDDLERAGLAALTLFDLWRWLPLAQARIVELHGDGAVLGALQRLVAQPVDAQELDAATAALAALVLQGGGVPLPPPGQDWLEVLERHPGLGAHLDVALRDLMGNETMGALSGVLANHPGQAALIRAVARARLPRMDADETAANAMGNLPGYLELLPDADDFWRGLAARDGFWDAVRSLDLELSTPVYARLITALENRAPLGRHLQALLNTVSAGQWSGALEGGQAPMRLIEALQALRQSKITVGSQLSDVLEGAVPSIVNNADGPRRARWFQLLHWTHSAAQEALLTKLSAAMVAGSVNDPAQLLLAGGATLAGPEGLATMPGAGGVLIPLLLARDDGIMWLLTERQLVALWIRNTAATDRERIRGELATLAAHRPDDAARLQRAWFSTAGDASKAE